MKYPESVVKSHVKVFALISAVCLITGTLGGCGGSKGDTASSSASPSSSSAAGSSGESAGESTGEPTEESSLPSETSGEVSAQSAAAGMKWVLVDSSFQEADDTNTEYYKIDVSYEGESDNKVRFKRSGGYSKDGKNYARCDAYFECQQPPATLEPEQPLTLEMSVKVENYEFASSSGSKSGINMNACWVQWTGTHFRNEDGNDYLDCNVNGDCYRTLSVTGTAGSSTVAGSQCEIRFCGNSFGTYTWTYELRE